MKEAGDLDAKTKKIFDSAKKGVILFSFGSIIDPRQMPEKMKQDFFKAFNEFPDYEFIMRYPGSLENITYPENVHLMDWVPQTAILKNKKTKLFISHGGLNSLNEAVFYATPTLIIPFFQDQYGNGAIVRNRKIGLDLFRQDINKNSIVKSLRELLFNPTFSENVKYLSQKFRNYPYSPKERFVKFVEYAAIYGDQGELELHGALLDYITLHNLDIWIPILFVLNIISYLLLKRAVSVILWTLFSKNKKVKYE